MTVEPVITDISGGSLIVVVLGSNKKTKGEEACRQRHAGARFLCQLHLQQSAPRAADL